MRNHGIAFNDVPSIVGFVVLLLISTAFGDSKSFQSDPSTGNLLAGGFLYDPRNEIYYLTGSTFTTTEEEDSSSTSNNKNCFLKILSKDLDEVIDSKFYNIETLSGVANSQESCNLIDMFDDSVIVGGIANYAVPPSPSTSSAQSSSSSMGVQGFLATIHKKNDDDNGVMAAGGAAAVETATTDDTTTTIGDVIVRHSIFGLNYPVAVTTSVDDDNQRNEVYLVSMAASASATSTTSSNTTADEDSDATIVDDASIFNSNNDGLFPSFYKADIKYDMTVEKYHLIMISSDVGRYVLDWSHKYSSSTSATIDGEGGESTTTKAGVTVGGVLVKETGLFVVGTTKGYGTAFGGTTMATEEEQSSTSEDGYITQLDLSSGRVLNSKRIVESNVANPNDKYLLTNICDDPNDPSAFFAVGAITTNPDVMSPVVMRITTTSSQIERQWSKVLSTTGGNAYALSCQATSDGLLYVAGQTHGDQVMLEGSMSTRGLESDDVFIAQLAVSSSSGGGPAEGEHLNWCQQFGSSSKDILSHGSNGLMVDADGNAVVYGHTYGNLFREQASESEEPQENNNTDLFVVTFSKEDGSHTIPIDDGTGMATTINNDESATHRTGPVFNAISNDDDDRTAGVGSDFDYFSATLSPLDNSGVTGEVKFFAPKPGSAMEGMVCFVGSASGLEPGLQSVQKTGGSDCTATNGCGVHVHAGSGPDACTDSVTQGGHWWDLFVEDPWLAVGYYETDAEGSATYSGCVSTGVMEGPGLDSRAFIVHSNDGGRVACGVISLDTEPTFDLLTASTVELSESGVASDVAVVANLFSDLPDHVCFVGEATGLESSLLSVHIRDEGGTDCIATNGCGVHVHDGTSCGDASSQGGHYYNPDVLPVDPWLLVGYTRSNEEGRAVFADCVQTGETDFKDRPFIIHSNDGGRVSCGLLSDPSNDDAEPVVDPSPVAGPSEPSAPEEEANQEALDMVPPNTDVPAEFHFFTASLLPLGDSGVTGAVKLFTPSSGPMEGMVCFVGLATGLEAGLESTHMPLVNGDDCTATNGCGVHLHTGLGTDACTNSTTQGGHLWDEEIFPEDPWKTVGYLQTDADGNAEYTACVPTGLAFEDVHSRAFIVHANDGSRVACGVLEPDIESSAAVLFTSTVELGESGASSGVNVVTNFFGNEEKSDYNYYVCFLGEATGLEPNLRSVHNDESGIAGTDCTATNGCGVHIHSGTGCDDATSQGGHFYDKEELLVDPWLIEGYSSTNEEGDATFANCIRTGETDYEGKPFIVHSNDGGRVSCGVLSIQEESPMAPSPTPPAPSPLMSAMKDPRNLTIPIYVGSAVAVLLCCCCFVVCVHAKRRTEARDKQKRMLGIFKYLHVFDVNDIDIRRSPAGGYHGTYLNDLAIGEGPAYMTSSKGSFRESTYSTADSSFRRPRKVHASVANDYTFMSHRALQAVDPDDDERSLDSQTELSSAL